MAKYNITHSCGHQVTHNLGGREKDRAGKAAWLAEQPCWNCKRAAERAAAAEATADLPALTGSDKQVAWATSIRAEAREQVAEILARIEKTGKSLTAEQQAVLDHLWSRTAAAWWIDRRAHPSGMEWLTDAQASLKQSGEPS